MGSSKTIYFVFVSVALILVCCLYTVGRFQVNISELRADLNLAEQKLQDLQPNSPHHRSKRFVKTSHGGGAKDDFVEQFEAQQSLTLNDRLYFVEQKLEQFVTKVIVQLKGTQSLQQSQIVKIQGKISHIFEVLKKHEETISEVATKLIAVEAQLSQYKTLSERITTLEEFQEKLKDVNVQVLEHAKIFHNTEARIKDITLEFQQKFDNLTVNLSHCSTTTEDSLKKQNDLQIELALLQQRITELTKLFETLGASEGKTEELVLHFQQKFEAFEKKLSQYSTESTQNVENYDNLQKQLVGFEKLISDHTLQFQDVQEYKNDVQKALVDIQESLTSLAKEVSQDSMGNNESIEKLQVKLNDVEEKVLKHAGLFKDMYAAQTEVTDIIPEVTQLSNNFTQYLNEYYVKNERNLKIQTDIQGKLDGVEKLLLEHEKLFQNTHDFEIQAEKIVAEFRQKLKNFSGDLSQCTKENAENLQVQEKLKEKVSDVEQKLLEYDVLSKRIRDFEAFESIVLKVVDLGKVLYNSVNQNDSETFQVLINLNVNLEFGDSKGVRPLMVAIRYFRNDFVSVLLNKGAKVNALDLEKKTALHWAAGVNNLIGAKLLVERGANVNSLDVELKSPLILAASIGNAEVLQFLVEKGADVEQKDHLSARAIHWATTMGQTDCVRILINANADINSESGRQTPMILAAKTGHVEILQLLLDRKANIECVDAYGNTPLMVAAETGHSKCVQALLDRGAKIEHRNKNEETALMIVARKGYQDILTLLLDNGAQTTSVDSSGNDALFFAKKGGHSTCIKILTLRGMAK